MNRLGLLARAVRAPFLIATVIPVLLGAAVATANGFPLDLYLLFPTLIGCVALHAGANVANDYYDWQSGADARHQPWPYNGGSQLLQFDLITPAAVRCLYKALYSLALLLGGIIAWKVGPLALTFGFAGLAFGHWYTAPPIAFSYHGYGELVTGITFGPLVVTGSYFVQSGRVDWLPLLVSLPVGLLITAVLYINEFPDYLQDRTVGKNTLVVRTNGRAIAIYRGLIVGAAALTLAIMWALGPIACLAASPLVWLASRPLLRRCRLTREALLPLQRHTLRLHTLTGLGLTIVFFVVGRG